MEAIKQLGTNGGGFLDTNSATTYENPTALTNWLSIYLVLSIPFALTYTFGKMVGSIRHGAALLVAMMLIFGAWVGFTSYAEHQGNPAVAAAGTAHQPTGNTEGKEVRFGDTTTALFGVASTNTSTGSADASYDSTDAQTTPDRTQQQRNPPVGTTRSSRTVTAGNRRQPTSARAPRCSSPTRKHSLRIGTTSASIRLLT